MKQLVVLLAAVSSLWGPLPLFAQPDYNCCCKHLSTEASPCASSSPCRTPSQTSSPSSPRDSDRATNLRIPTARQDSSVSKIPVGGKPSPVLLHAPLLVSSDPARGSSPPPPSLPLICTWRI